MTWLFDPRPQPGLDIAGDTRRFAVSRIFCVGRNYAAHVAEMGNVIDRAAPVYFTKSCYHLAETDQTLPFPSGTSDYHHEVEFVLALGAPLSNATPDTAGAAIFGYGVGLDMTRRDLQAICKEKRHPWDVAKDVEASAIVGPLVPAAQFGDIAEQEIGLEVNGTCRQRARLSDMIWPVPDLLAHLSHLYDLQPGDLILTGTPSGVAAVKPGDSLHAWVDGVPPLDVRFAGT